MEEQTTCKRTETENKKWTTYRHLTCFQTFSCCQHHSLLEQKGLSLHYAKFPYIRCTHDIWLVLLKMSTKHSETWIKNGCKIKENREKRTEKKRKRNMK